MIEAVRRQAKRVIIAVDPNPPQQPDRPVPEIHPMSPSAASIQKLHELKMKISPAREVREEDGPEEAEDVEDADDREDGLKEAEDQYFVDEEDEEAGEEEEGPEFYGGGDVLHRRLGRGLQEADRVGKWRRKQGTRSSIGSIGSGEFRGDEFGGRVTAIQDVQGQGHDGGREAPGETGHHRGRPEPAAAAGSPGPGNPRNESIGCADPEAA